MATSAALPLIPWSKKDILKERSSVDVTISVSNTAIDLFVLGYPKHANRLIQALHDAGNGMQFDRALIDSLYAAWLAYDCMPSFVSDPDPNKIFDGLDLGTAEGKSRLQGFRNPSAPKGFPRKQADKFREGTLDEQDLEVAFGALYGESGIAGDGDGTVAAVVELALYLGEREKARQLVQKDVVAIYQHVKNMWRDQTVTAYKTRDWVSNRLGVANATRIWTVLKDEQLGHALDVQDADLEAYVNKGCEVIQQRFANGPIHEYAGKSIRQLLQLLDESYIAARKEDPYIGGAMSLDTESPPKSFLKAPATNDEFHELEAKLASDRHSFKLPAEYVELLKVTNGFYPGTNPENQSSIFYGSAAVEHDEEWIADLGFMLFPFEFTNVYLENVDFPDDVHAFSIGAGGDEGYVLLIEPESTKATLERFEEEYAKASERQKRMYERAAMDLYGGLERLRKMEWLVVEHFNWDSTQYIYG
ncbi:hypothetical protein EJ04DRAFT_583341 [Polyplosphaeria fusca]|uniref:Knr4/Smi1-like domain-containing protein n=1 Tax=Polyplosphaeria fusca TaxID=682080 RepID=A0A9P4R8P1_9PLEO|nr:hypothetical protein EJ04DRAFT_583341 [Polyplosphaeria fusca]